MTKRVLFGVLSIIWLGVIFWFSATNGKGSNTQSKQVAYYIVSASQKVAYKLKIIEKYPSEEQINKYVKSINPILRKIAHGIIYFLLAVFLLLAFDTNKENYMKNFFIIICICFLYSLTDEFHQTFINDRTGKFLDCIIDVIGAIIGCAVFRIIFLFFPFSIVKKNKL